MLIADRENFKLQSCDLAGNCVWLGGNPAFGLRNTAGTFDLPHGLAVSGEGRVAVADEDNHALQICSGQITNCFYVGSLGSESNPPSSSLGRWAYPQDVAFDSRGRVYGIDTGNDRVQVLREDFGVYRVFMGSGSGLGQVNGARGIALMPDGRVVIADTGNHRIQVCDIGSFVTTPVTCEAFGNMGAAPGQFMGPIGVEVDHLERIWIADTGNHRIQVCDEQGDCVAFGEFGTGEFQFDSPHDVAVHPAGDVAVVDTANNRVQVFSTESLINEEPRDPLLRDALDRAAARIAESLSQTSAAQKTEACTEPSCLSAAGDRNAVGSGHVIEAEKMVDSRTYPVPTLDALGRLLLFLMLLGLAYRGVRVPRG
jgi:DNA-binding beta-propeller fold protein YncE